MPKVATPNQTEREFETGTDESFKNANATGGATHNENQRVTYANIKRTYDVYQDLDIQAARQALTEQTRLNQIASQALQNAVETANMVGKQAVRHSDIAIDAQWNPVQQGAADTMLARTMTIDDASLKAIGAMERGIVLYLRQEGRGIGLANKIRAYALQDYGMDTVEANLALGFRDDERDYAVAAHMLMSLKVVSIKLMTNNPRKLNDLARYGIRVNGRLPHVLPPNPHNEFYLRTKAEKSGHMIDLKDFKGKIHLPEQLDRPVVKGMTEEQVKALYE